MAGGYSLDEVLKKDAYNYVNKSTRVRIDDGNANSTIVYLEGKVNANPMSMARYNTCIFGFELVLDKSITSYTWLLENFWEVMCNKPLSVVITDRDNSTRETVRIVFSKATHQLCAWHIEKNVTSNIKDVALLLTTLLDSIEEFFTSVYTRAFFVDVKKEIEVVSLVNFVRVRWSLTTKVHTVEQYGHPRRHVVVLRDKNMGRLECDCYFCDTRKFSCKHMFFMMKHKHFMKVPEWLVLKRWTKHAKCLDDYVEKPSNDGDWGFLLRHGICILRPIGCSFLGIQ
ncbi:hypothetical protein AHAS_Ahas01G0186800 [Arachis hypogaea]